MGPVDNSAQRFRGHGRRDRGVSNGPLCAACRAPCCLLLQPGSSLLKRLGRGGRGTARESQTGQLDPALHPGAMMVRCAYPQLHRITSALQISHAAKVDLCGDSIVCLLEIIDENARP